MKYALQHLDGDTYLWANDDVSLAWLIFRDGTHWGAKFCPISAIPGSAIKDWASWPWVTADQVSGTDRIDAWQQATGVKVP